MKDVYQDMSRVNRGVSGERPLQKFIHPKWVSRDSQYSSLQGLTWLRELTFYQFWALNQNWTPDYATFEAVSHLPKRRSAFCLMLWKMGHPLCNPNMWRLVLQVAASALVAASHWDVTSGVCQLPLRLEEHGVTANGPRQDCQPSQLWRCARLPTERA